MTRRKLIKLQRELRALRTRLGAIRRDEVAAIATQVGRVRVDGRHPVYRKQGRPPLPIPDHPGDLARGTAGEIVSVLEEDIELLLFDIDDDEDVQE